MSTTTIVQCTYPACCPFVSCVSCIMKFAGTVISVQWKKIALESFLMHSTCFHHMVVFYSTSPCMKVLFKQNDQNCYVNFLRWGGGN